MIRNAMVLVGTVLFTAATALASPGDEYSRIARISYLVGNVSFQQANEIAWTAASINMALQPGDRIYTGETGRAEIEIDDGSVFYLAEKTDLEILSLREDFIQVRMLLGLCTLNLRSSIACEISSPAAAFDTLRKGIYRFDVVENGDTDAIVRQGLLEAANNTFLRNVESGSLIHITPGEDSTNVISRYERRDAWDDWTDRRDADAQAYESKKYLPDYVYAGVSDLDRYGRWVVVDSYGPAWVPSYADAAWSPYWDGRWVYRPHWGWTWVSYEPWGWLPYHYGRWYHHRSYGWCWLPGAAFSFHFWSPGLVRFYYGPSWVSWCPLGPGDYYNVNHYHHSRSYGYHLNNMRMAQHRSPEDLFNRSVGGAFRTVHIDHFTGSSLGSRGRDVAMNVDQPWKRGSIVTGRLDVKPSPRSAMPAPDRPVARPVVSSGLPSIVRAEPSVEPSGGRNGLKRISFPGARSVSTSSESYRSAAGSGRSDAPSPAGIDAARGQPTSERPSSSIWNRPSGNPAPTRPGETRPDRTPPAASGESATRTGSRQVPAAGPASGRQEIGRPLPQGPGSSGSTIVTPSRSDRPAPAAGNPRTEGPAPRRMENSPAQPPLRNERPAPPPSSSSTGEKPPPRP